MSVQAISTWHIYHILHYYSHYIISKALPFHHNMHAKRHCVCSRRRAFPCLFVIPFKFQYTICVQCAMCSIQQTWSSTLLYVALSTNKEQRATILHKNGSTIQVKQPKRITWNWTKIHYFVCSSHGQTFFNPKLYASESSSSYPDFGIRMWVCCRWHRCSQHRNAAIWFAHRK